MRIPESKNLKYDSWPQSHFEGPEKIEANQCLLSEFYIEDNKIEFRFANGSTAFLRSKNIEGDLEIELIGKKLVDFIGKSYKEILEASF